jgi:hypothetical protein
MAMMEEAEAATLTAICSRMDAEAANVYDRSGKGNDLVIETGKEEVTYAHTVDAPTEVLTGQSESGRMLAVWISDATGTKTLVKLQAI